MHPRRCKWLEVEEFCMAAKHNNKPNEQPEKATEIDQSAKKRNNQLIGQIKHAKIVGQIKKPRKLTISSHDSNENKKLKKKSKSTSYLEDQTQVQCSNEARATKVKPRLKGGARTERDRDSRELVMDLLHSKHLLGKRNTNNQCNCLNRINEFARLINYGPETKFVTKICPTKLNQLNVLHELASILSLIFLGGLLLTCFLCTKPKETNYLQLLLRRLYLYLFHCLACIY